MNRRDILRRTAAAGLLATPAAGLLTGCATGDGGNDRDRYEGTKSAQNPLGVAEDAPLEVVIFNGGFGDEYAKAHETMYRATYPKAEIRHSATQEISKTLQPRFVDGTPPDVINNSGAGQIDFNGLVSQGALADLGELLDAPSLDIPGKTVRETLLPILLLPVLSPVLIGATKAFEAALGGVAADGWPWCGLLVVFSVLYLAFGTLAFGTLLEES